MRSESYGSQPLQDLDVLIPDDPLDDRAPLFVFVHGGAWRVGDKSDVSASLLPRLGRTTGLTIYNVNYRLSPVVTHPAHVHDLAAALAMLPADRDLVLMGHSCGSFLCTSLLFDTRLAAPAIASLRSRVVGLVASEPIWDPADLLAEYEDYRSFLEAAFGSTALLAAQSPPSHYALPPGATHRLRILVSHTREDELLSLRQPERLAAAVWTMGGREGTWTGERTFEAGGIEVVVDFDGVHGKHDDVLQGEELPAQVARWLAEQGWTERRREHA